MLIQFNFSNFKSYRDSTTLDMTASPTVSEFPWQTREYGGETVLPVSGIWGANAGGKSNVLAALDCMARYVRLSFGYGGRTDGSVDFKRDTAFAFDSESEKEPTEFEVLYTDDGKPAGIYQYGFSLGDNGVEEEWLYYKGENSKEYKRIFDRNGLEFNFEKGVMSESDENLLKKGLTAQSLLVSLGAKLNDSSYLVLQNVYEWFMHIDVTDFGNPENDFAMSKYAPGNFLNEAVQKDVIKFFSAFDKSIIGFDVKEIPNDSSNGTIRFRVRSVHHTRDGQSKELRMRDESAGTLKMFILYQHLLNALRFGGLLVVDELDSKLHPLLQRIIVQEFTNEETNPNHAQLIFTVHDPWLLSSQLLRRDEIWFAEKADDGSSSLYSLADFVDSDNKPQDFEPNYLLGRYGAIPEIRHFNLLKEADQHDEK